MAVDLSGPQALVVDLILLDRCDIIRPTPDAVGAVFNDVTGNYENFGAASVQVATNEPCKFRLEGEARYDEAPHELIGTVLLRWNLDSVQHGDIVHMTASVDARVQGRRFQVVEIQEGTIRVMRRVTVVRRRGAHDPGA